MDFNKFRIRFSNFKKEKSEEILNSMKKNINLLRDNFVELREFKLSELFRRFNFYNDYINSSIFNQIDFEQISNHNEKILESGLVLYNNIKNKLEDEIKFFKTVNYNNGIEFNKYNQIKLDGSKLYKEVMISIENFEFDKDYIFEITIYGYDDLEKDITESFTYVIKDIIPYDYGGFYKEKIDLTNDVFVSKFNIQQNSDIIIYDIDNNKTDYSYEIIDNKIHIDTTTITQEGLVLEYTPNHLNSIVDVNFYITKIGLNTDYKEKDIKCILVGDD
jgi:hypothetical protein